MTDASCPSWPDHPCYFENFCGVEACQNCYSFKDPDILVNPHNVPQSDIDQMASTIGTLSSWVDPHAGGVAAAKVLIAAGWVKAP